MSGSGAPADGPSPVDGSRTAAEGTPYPVDFTPDRQARVAAVVFVAGPVIWSVHFLLVYLVAEAGCSGDGPGLVLFDPPVPKVVTLVSTAVAAAAALASAAWAYRRWRSRRRGPAAGDAGGPGGALEGHDRGASLAFVGLLLSLLAFVVVLFVGVPALVLPSC